jgi:hypothetical protein
MSGDMSTEAPTDPSIREWADAKYIRQRFSIPRSSLYEMAGRGVVKTVSLAAPGKQRGKRLFNINQISELLESIATGGSAQ